jgi:hypothetical protein
MCNRRQDFKYIQSEVDGTTVYCSFYSGKRLYYFGFIDNDLNASTSEDNEGAQGTHDTLHLLSIMKMDPSGVNQQI